MRKVTLFIIALSILTQSFSVHAKEYFNDIDAVMESIYAYDMGEFIEEMEKELLKP